MVLSAVDIVQEVASNDCSEPTLVVTGESGAAVWLWVAPSGYGPWQIPYGAEVHDYVLVTNLDVVAVEQHSWTAVKRLFD